MRATTAAQIAALQATDRTSRVRIKLEDPDGAMVDVTDLEGINWLEDVHINVTTDPPISTARIRLWKTVGLLSLAPLIEGSALNRDSAGAYAPFLNPNRAVTVETMTKLAGETVEDAELKLLWEGLAGPVEWGGDGRYVEIQARDPMTRLNRTFIETVSEVGNDDNSEDVEDVMQEILDANFGSAVIPLTSAATSFPVKAYDLGNVTVLAAHLALRDLIGWNLHWRWDASESEFRLTLWEPDRTNTTAAWTFGQDDYYAVHRVGLDDDGIRNKWETVYIDTNGDEQSEDDTDATSISIYETRFARIDARGTSVVTQAQAQALAAAALSDTSIPPLPQQIECALFWPAELGDLYAFSPNREYDTEQKAAVFAYQHILTPDKCRTLFTLSGKPSGGYARWHGVAQKSAERRPRPGLVLTFDANGQLVVSATSDDKASHTFVTVGDGVEPDDPTPSVNDGVIVGGSGTVSTGVKVTTGNDAHVKAVAAYEDGAFSSVTTARQARRIGPAHKDTSTRSHTGDTNETTLETITIPANTLGTNGGLRFEARWSFIDNFGADITLRVKLEGSQLFATTLDSIGDFHATLLIFNDGATNDQHITGHILFNVGVRVVLVGPVSLAVDSTQDMDLTVTGQLADSADTVELEMSYVELIGTD